MYFSDKSRDLINKSTGPGGPGTKRTGMSALHTMPALHMTDGFHIMPALRFPDA